MTIPSKSKSAFPEEAALLATAEIKLNFPLSWLMYTEIRMITRSYPLLQKALGLEAGHD